MRKLTLQDRYEIYMDYMSSDNKTATAKEFDVSPRTVGRCYDMFKGKTKSEINAMGVDTTDYTVVVDDNTPEASSEALNEGFNEEYPYVITGETITVYIDSEPRVMDKTHTNFDRVVKVLLSGDHSSIPLLMDLPKVISEYSLGDIEYSDGTLRYKGFEIHNSLTAYIIDAFNKGVTLDKHLRFLDNLMMNPSSRAVNELYDFIEVGKMPLTDDGCFLAYKKVRDNYYDVHSGTIRNAVGDKPSMPRNMVDENKNNTCSYGLHFCSYGYLGSFGGARTMVVKINPADVVSIPADYNNTKGRACTYEVIRELKSGEVLTEYSE